MQVSLGGKPVFLSMVLIEEASAENFDCILYFRGGHIPILWK